MVKVLGTAKIREKGQITIPEEVRRFLKIKPGDKISLLWEKGQVIIKREKTIHEDFEPSD